MEISTHGCTQTVNVFSTSFSNNVFTITSSERSIDFRLVRAMFHVFKSRQVIVFLIFTEWESEGYPTSGNRLPNNDVRNLGLQQYTSRARETAVETVKMQLVSLLDRFGNSLLATDSTFLDLRRWSLLQFTRTACVASKTKLATIGQNSL